MKLDIRLPLGLMFFVFGIILTVYGFFSSSEIYEKSMGINLNLWWGIALAVFGISFLIAVYRATHRHP